MRELEVGDVVKRARAYCHRVYPSQQGKLDAIGTIERICGDDYEVNWGNQGHSMPRKENVRLYKKGNV